MAWVWFFDLDGTLYTDRTGLWPAISERITLYLQKFLNLTREEALTLRKQLMATYGTTLRGLQALYPSTDAAAYFAFVHDLPLEDYIGPDARLAETLAALPGTKWVFTNADAIHAQRVLRLLGVEEAFTGVIDLFAIQGVPKPLPEAYQRALALAGHPRPEQSILVDDQRRNLLPAKALGMYAIWVTPEAEADDAVDAVIPDVYHLPEAWTRLVSQAGVSKEERTC